MNEFESEAVISRKKLYQEQCESGKSNGEWCLEEEGMR